MYSVAPKDGTALATVDQSTPVQQAVGDPTIKFDTAKFNFIGNPVVDNNVVVTWHTSGVKTIEDATKKEYAIGATGLNTSSQYPQALNIVAGTKFKIIFGYPGANEINLAMENGEVAGRGSNSWASYKATKPDWIRDKKMNVLVQIGLQKAADLPDVPLLMDLAKNDEDRAALKLLSAPPDIGRPVFAPPGIPKDREAALRAALAATLKDPAFLAEAQKQKLDISPASGEDLAERVERLYRTPTAVVERTQAVRKQALGLGNGGPGAP
jgi:tripartite-type tricarboxylate transporter receptor subunit TctC